MPRVLLLLIVIVTGACSSAKKPRAQRTRPQPDTVFFDKDGYFVTVRWEGVDREALRQLVRELEKKP
jgi:hypothetical protein